MQSLFRNRAFLVILASGLFEHLAIWVRNMALLYYVMDMTGNSPLYVSILTAVEYAPIFVFSFIGGALADRWNPKRTMVGSDLLGALSILPIVLLLGSGYWLAIFLTTFISAILSQFYMPASAKIFKRAVPAEMVGQAVAFNQTMSNLFMLIGPLVGTAIYSQLGIYPSLWTLFGLFLLSAAILTLLPKTTGDFAPAETSLITEIREGFRYVWSHGDLKRLAYVFTILGLAVGIMQPLEVFIVTNRLGLPKEALQWFAAAGGVGLLIGGIASSKVIGRFSGRWLLFGGLAVMCLSVLVIAQTSWTPLSLGLRVVNGILIALLQILTNTYTIQLVDEAFIGRVNGILIPLWMGMMLLGTLLAGPLTVALSLVVTYSLAGLILLVAGWAGLGMTFGKKDQV